MERRLFVIDRTRVYASKTSPNEPNNIRNNRQGATWPVTPR